MPRKAARACTDGSSGRRALSARKGDPSVRLWKVPMLAGNRDVQVEDGVGQLRCRFLRQLLRRLPVRGVAVFVDPDGVEGPLEAEFDQLVEACAQHLDQAPSSLVGVRAVERALAIEVDAQHVRRVMASGHGRAL